MSMACVQKLSVSSSVVTRRRQKRGFTTNGNFHCADSGVARNFCIDSAAPMLLSSRQVSVSDDVEATISEKTCMNRYPRGCGLRNGTVYSLQSAARLLKEA
ncbi:hypothetical protein PF007_g23904 [Phytophthora fragariae]|uniref:Uncharacterized protein n=1 Tax=Phytophthora fragariae TaxID=53985 RepID=A0A6A3QLK3_9STRA|nr:hypothetical protein PF006_g29904 [Phytophthora fragariae]KAE9078337.1 hypothetical protein PF007_g23904 [Phytophthora fragariae]KAE9172136.1 hypothetical protein PF004_g27357 [Phytophthora fragariae]KAE9270939.1 hypothetical protein PF001_g28600 [Phytophthora fragariae]